MSFIGCVIKTTEQTFCWIDESQALDLMKGKFRKLGSLIYVDFVIDPLVSFGCFQYISLLLSK